MIIKFIYIAIAIQKYGIDDSIFEKTVDILIIHNKYNIYIFPSLFVLKYLFKKISNNCRFTLKVIDIMHNSIQKAGDSLNPLIF